MNRIEFTFLEVLNQTPSNFYKDKIQNMKYLNNDDQGALLSTIWLNYGK